MVNPFNSLFEKIPGKESLSVESQKTLSDLRDELVLFFLISPNGVDVDGPFLGTYPQDVFHAGWKIVGLKGDIIGHVTRL